MLFTIVIYHLRQYGKKDAWGFMLLSKFATLVTQARAIAQICTFILMSVLLCACGGGGTNSNSSNNSSASSSPTIYSAKSGVAQKGPLIAGSTVTAQELDSNLSPTGKQYSYQINSDLGTFSPTSAFTSRYIGLSATGYYFDEVRNVVSNGPVTLTGYSDLSSDTVINVNILTTLAYQRIQHLVAVSNMTYAAARKKAESEVLAALNIPIGSYGAFGTLDISGSSDGDHILAAISSLFVYGTSAGTLNQLIANFQSDIGANGVITNPDTTAALVTAASYIELTDVATNLTQYYAKRGLTFNAVDLAQWIAHSGDGVIGKFTFNVPDAAPATVFTFPSAVVTQFAGTPVSVSVGRLSINGNVASGNVTFNSGDIVTLSPNVGDFPNGILTSYLVSSSNTNLVKVSFIRGLVSIDVTPHTPSVPAGLTQQFLAMGVFSDNSAADLTNAVTWTSATSTVASVNPTTGLANSKAIGSSVITAMSGSLSGQTTLNVAPAILESIQISPSPAYTGVGITQQLTAVGTYSDATTVNITTSTTWTSSNLDVATIVPSTGLVSGVSVGAATITASIGSVMVSAPLNVVTHVWSNTGEMPFPPDHPSAALLSNGKVLVVGGNASQIFDPLLDTWSVTAPTPIPIASATLLKNGKVLVMGGTTLTDSALYDPIADAWSMTGSMLTAVSQYTTTLLQNGKVLVTGGVTTANVPSANAELYDPDTGTWSTTAGLAIARSGFSATLLQNGEVIVAGGYDVNGNIISGSELYNPITETWTMSGSMPRPLALHTATLLQSGLVLVAGGRLSVNGVEVISGVAELYDPVSGAWSLTGSLDSARYLHTATLLKNGQVLAAGGSQWFGFDTMEELYDPLAGTWSVTAGMNSSRDYMSRQGHVAILLQNGTVLVAGGSYWDAPAQLYWP